MEEPEIIQGGLSVDDRGSVTFANGFDFKGVKRFYQVYNYHTDIIRAYHGHKFEQKFVFVPNGAALVITVPMDEFKRTKKNPKNLRRFVLSSNKPMILRIPKNFANGFRSLEPNTIIQFFSTRTLDQSLKDDIRFDWDFFGEDVWSTENR